MSHSAPDPVVWNHINQFINESYFRVSRGNINLNVNIKILRPKLEAVP